MLGNWVAECTLCKFAERHVEQDDALKAATLHAMKEHTEEQAVLASGKWITHVQNRAADALGFEVPKPPEVVQPFPQPITDVAPVLPPANPGTKSEGE